MDVDSLEEKDGLEAGKDYSICGDLLSVLELMNIDISDRLVSVTDPLFEFGFEGDDEWQFPG